MVVTRQVMCLMNMEKLLMEIYDRLFRAYGSQGWWPITPSGSHIPVYSRENIYKEKNDREKLEISIGAILTQNTSWKNAEKSIIELNKRDLIDRDKLRKIDIKELADLIRSSGYYNQKAKKIKAFVEFRGEITRENLLKIWGIGPETADSILLYAYNIPVFVVDAYTRRLLHRMGLIKDRADYHEIQALFMENLPGS